MNLGTSSLSPEEQERWDKAFEQAKAENAATCARICAKYDGLDAQRDGFLIRDINRAEHEQTECEGCEGIPCRKRRNCYIVPTVKHTEFGWRVAGAQCRHWWQALTLSRSKRAQIPPNYRGKTFEDYRVDDANERAVKVARWYAEAKPPRSLYLYGDCGTGKTFLASIVAQEFIRAGWRVIFGDVPSLLDEIKRTFGTNEDSGEIIDRYSTCDLLVLDDIGAGQVTDWNVGVLYEIVNARYGAEKPMIITSNYSLDELTTRLSLSDPFMGKRITSRLSEMCHQAFLGTNDRRSKSC